MRTKKFAIVVVLGSLALSSCSMFQKGPASNASVATTSPTGQPQQPTVPQDVVNRYTSGWPDSSIQAAKTVLLKHGEPTESTPSMLVWRNVQPFKRITVYREEVTHRFPILHKDSIEHVVSYRIPVDKAAELTKFDGSVTFDRTKGELASRSNDESMNILALNLASDILNGKRDASSARTEYGKAAVDFLNGNKSVLTQNLQFIGQNNTADADLSTKINWAQSQEARPNNQSGKNPLLKQAQEEEIAE
ncbi:MAG: hypothetical protein H0V66_05860 [Bdellovibrionales bacterium]|nr:hypothetical protein [Bdellovibrionales bacterium]